MLSLALDTSTRWGRFALARPGELLAYRPLNVAGSYADALLPVIEDMLAETGLRKSDLEAVAVTSGPGSFTGVRIGVATAKGLAWGLGCSLAAVTSLAGMAAALLDDHPDAEYAVPALDARRGEIFSGVYTREGGWVREVVPADAASPDAWWSRILAAVPDPDAPAYGGDGSGLLLGQGEDMRPELAGRGEPVLRSWSSAHPATARSMALALAAGALPEVHPFTLVPEYMRVSDAEVKKRVDLTPLTPGTDVSAHRSEGPTA
jgi:tRNA threonylcarbamoyladenosine biosynthesis protein TsaB